MEEYAEQTIGKRRAKSRGVISITNAVRNSNKKTVAVSLSVTNRPNFVMDKIYKFVRTSQETHYASAKSPTG
jgi:hypothetical protein